MDSPTLVQRQVAFATGTGVPDGFVEENGRLIPFWYSRVSIHSYTRDTWTHTHAAI